MFKSEFMKNIVRIVAMSLGVTIGSHAIAQQAPVIVNPQTGAVVNLTRAYWDANVDIANKNLQCDYYSFNAETGVFEKGADGTNPLYLHYNFHILNIQYRHSPLVNGTTQVNNVLFSDAKYIDPPYWSVVDGVYGGPAPLSLSEFVEIVAHNASTDNAVRVWHPDESGSAYSVCYDLEGTSLFPTGTIGSGNTQLIDVDDFTFDFPHEPLSVPEIINRETGEPVQFSRGRWSYNKDIAGRRIFCNQVGWNTQFQNYQRVPDTGVIGLYFPYTGEEEMFGASKNLIDEGYFSIRTRRVSTFTLPGDFHTDRYMEITEEGYRMWINSGAYLQCVVDAVLPTGLRQVESSSFGPTVTLPIVADNCDYTLAEQYNGWGWNQVTQQSCPPPTPVADNCDYSDASQFEGWGWNATLRDSCPPCVDTDGDGWGWNGSESCRVIATTCIDTDGDGWGWDGSASCLME